MFLMTCAWNMTLAFVCSANKLTAECEAKLPSESSRCLMDALSCLLCHFLSFTASGSGMNEEAWTRGGIESKEGSTGLRSCLGTYV